MTDVGVAVRLEPRARLRLYADVLPLAAADFNAAIEREAADNPWLAVDPPSSSGHMVDEADAIADKPSLTDHLERQLAARDLEATLRRAATGVVAALDERGYLRDDVSLVARLCAVSPTTVDRAIAIVQALEPAGLAARSLGERFRLQLAADGRTTAATDAVTSDLEGFARDGPETFAERSGFERAEIDDALRRLRACDADPTGAFARRVPRVVPELAFEKHDDELTVRLLRDVWPSIELVRFMPIRGASKPLREALARARSIVEVFERRATTLQRLGDVLLARQRDYFVANGAPSKLVPLSGRDIARELGCSESTVSRALSARFAQTPFGVIALRTLVARRPGSLALTTQQARDHVRDVFTASPWFSDAAVARALRLRGVRLARRTVAKYRREAGLPAQSERAR